jgi:pyruvate kinase
MEATALEKPLDQLQALLDEVTRLCEHVLYRSAIRLDQQARFLDQQALTKSCVNLAHYLALRELDLRPLQEKLAEVGLSSLGRSESHVFATLHSVVTLLSRTLEQPHNIACRLPHPEFREGFEILTQNTAKLLGPSKNQHETRIMVTLATETASDTQLVNDLIHEGMDCARINCAHDSPEIWARMIENVRQAAESHKRECRILMDLAGHKVRTGPVAMQPTTLHIKVKKNGYGLALQPARIILVPESGFSGNQANESDTTTLPLPDSIFDKLLVGDHLRLTDARGKKRNIHIYASDTPRQFLASCNKGVYLQSGSKLFLCRKQGLRYQVLDSIVFRHNLEQEVNITLKQGDDLILHTTAIPGEPAEFNRHGRLLAPAHIACTLPAAIKSLSIGAPVWIDDGKINCRVIQTSPDAVTLRVLQTGPKGARLKPDKGLNFPETDLKLPALSEKDKQDLDFVCQHADLVGFSFVENGEDIRLLIKEIRQRNRAYLPIVAKIETQRAVRNLPEILFSSLSYHPLAIMIARGDLAVELGSVRMAEIQEEMLWLCEAAHVPVIWATQVLESIAKHGVRSRPEFTDAAMGIRAECVMLNKGPYILDAVRSLDAVLQRMQAHQRKKISRLRALHW